ncbi:hypothetical protein WBO78_24205 [Bosea sp. CCNWLW174]|uniref:hypothetical protein n=1 Tax=unclassified Bosea (in: a-proteobacteria) TaxID=2653178 RepID=UPI0030149251
MQAKITGPLAGCILLAVCNTAPTSAIAEDLCAGLSGKGHSDCLKLSSRIKSQLMLQYSSLGVGSGNSVSGGSGTAGIGGADGSGRGGNGPSGSGNGNGSSAGNSGGGAGSASGAGTSPGPGACAASGLA